VRTRRHKVTVLGLGAMGARHARVLASMPERFDLLGGYDVRREADAPAGVARLSGEADAIARAELVVVATPIGAHAATVARALAAGRHVLVEKPLCATQTDASTLAQAAARGPGRLFVGHSERFNPVVRALSRLVRDAPLTLDLQRVGPCRPSEAGVLVNLGVHDLDLAAYLGGGDVRLRGAVGGEDFADLLFETLAGTVGHIHVDRAAPHRRRAVVLTTPMWTYEGDLLAHRLLRTSRDSGDRTEVPLPLEEPLVAQARAVADALDGAAIREIATGPEGAAAVTLATLATSLCATAAARREHA
jgi:UDP-N-acetylglucosamine 3-dehydrogenase